MDLDIKNLLGEKLDSSFSPGNPEARQAGALVVLGHGVTGNKDRPVIVDAAKAFNQEGFDTLRFSFSGNGDSEGEFKAATITKEVADLQSVLDAVSQTYSKIIYTGHSMGGAVGVLTAAKDRRIQALVSLAGMVHTKVFAETEFGEETPGQGCMWDDESCPLSVDYMKDLCETVVSVEPQVSAIEVPWLLIHGTADDVVFPKDTQTVEAIRGNSVSTVYIDGADHSFSDTSHKSQMLQAIRDWARSTLA